MDWELQMARAIHIWPIVVNCARDKKTITYGDLADVVGTNPLSAGLFLCVIQVYCGINNLPPLQICVVNAQTGQPGPGCLSHRIPRDLKDAMWLDVTSYDWPDIAPFGSSDIAILSAAHMAQAHHPFWDAYPARIRQLS